MKLVRYEAGAGWKAGVVVDDVVHDLRGTLGRPEPGDRIAPVRDVQLGVPAQPTKILCVGRNYAAHIAEMGRPTPERPFFFIKTPNTLVGPGGATRRPPGVRRFDYEGELAVVIGRRAHQIRRDEWADHVLGYTCGNDMTVRDWQESDGQWARAKSADTLCPLGPWIETDIADPGKLALRTYVNGEVRQDSTTADMVFTVADLLSFISAYLTLEPGDVVLTGTPGGVSNVDAGDVVEVEIEGIGRLRTTVEIG